MTLYVFANSTLSKSADMNTNMARIWTAMGIERIRDLIDRAATYSTGNIEGWEEAYISSTGRNSSADTTLTGAEFSTNKYRIPVVPAFTGPYIIINATSLTIASFAINNCTCTKIGYRKWIVTCSVGTDAVKKAQLYKTIFYGTTGADIQYKLTKASENTGWLSCGTSPIISSFVPFTGQPTTLIVRLIPKSSSPTAGYPGIYGFHIQAE